MTDVLFPQTKIFCIGMNKTGTTSIGHALGMLGYARSGWTGQSAQFTLRWHEGQVSPKMIEVMARHDVFEDIPWPLYFRELDKMCPNAKFVLTLRRDEAAWLSSIQRHIARRGDWVGHFLIYGSYDPVADAEKYLETYRAHNAAVRAHFADRPDKLLEVSFDTGDGWDKICGFLGLPVPDKPFPHANKAPETAAS